MSSILSSRQDLILRAEYFKFPVYIRFKSKKLRTSLIKTFSTEKTRKMENTEI